MTPDPLTPLVRALLHTLWQGGLVFLLLSALLFFIPVRRVRLRYGVSLTAFFAILIAGVATWAWLDTAENRQPPQAAGATATAPPEIPTPQENAPVIRSHQIPPQSASPAPQREPAPEWSHWIVLIWAAGVLLFLIRSARAVLGAGALCREAREVAEREVLLLALQIREAFQIPRPIRVMVSDQIRIPVVIGIFRPAILLPASLITGFPPDYLRAVLAHEFAHVARWDYLVNIGQMMVEALLFFNPFVWWISRQVRHEREACCDLAASAHCSDPSLYLRAVIACAESAGEGALSPAAVAIASDRQSLTDRAKRLLSPGHSGSVHVRWLTLAAIFALIGLLLFAMGRGAFWAAHILTPQERIDRIVELRKAVEVETAMEREGKVTITGSVVTENGEPLPPDTVVRIDSDSIRGGYRTQYRPKDGKLDFTIRAGIIRLAVWDQQYAPVFSGPLVKDADLKNIRIVLTKGFPATIHVTDPNGKPLEGARLTGYYDGPPQTGRFTVSTDAKGNAVIAHAANVPAVLELTKAGYQMDRRENIRLSAQKPISWIMNPAQPLTGRVVGAADGKPVGNAKIGIVNIEGVSNMGYDPDYPEALTTTNAQGEFLLNTLQDQSVYALLFRAEGFRPALKTGVTAQDGSLTVQLEPPLSISGKVITSEEWKSGTIECHQTLVVGRHGRGMTKPAKLEVKDGIAHFTFKDLYEAETELLINGKSMSLGYLRASLHDLTVDASPMTPLSPHKAPKREVVVRFEPPKNGPLPQGSFGINFYQNGISPGISRVIVGKTVKVENGEGRFEVPIPNELDLRTEGLIGYSFQRRIREAVPGGEAPLEILVQVTPAGSIHGELREANGDPAYGSYISVLEADEAEFSRAPVLDLKNHASGRADILPRFVATPLPMGRDYAVLLWRGTTFALSPSLRVDEKHAIRRADIVIPEGTTVHGRVVDESGKPIPLAEFSFEYSTPWKQNFSSGGRRTEIDGRFSLPNVNLSLPGEYRLNFASRSKYVPMEVILPRKKSGITITLKKGKVLTGIAIDETTGKPMPGMNIRAVSENLLPATPGRAPQHLTVEAEAPTDEEGRFRFSNLPEGFFTLGCWGANPVEKPRVEAGWKGAPVIFRLRPVPRG